MRPMAVGVCLLMVVHVNEHGTTMRPPTVGRGNTAYLSRPDGLCCPKGEHHGAHRQAPTHQQLFTGQRHGGVLRDGCG